MSESLVPEFRRRRESSGIADVVVVAVEGLDTVGASTCGDDHHVLEVDVCDVVLEVE